MFFILLSIFIFFYLPSGYIEQQWYSRIEPETPGTYRVIRVPPIAYPVEIGRSEWQKVGSSTTDGRGFGLPPLARWLSVIRLDRINSGMRAESGCRVLTAAA